MSDLSQEKQREIRLHLMTAQVILSNLIVGVRDASTDKTVSIDTEKVLDRLERIQKEVITCRNIIEDKE